MQVGSKNECVFIYGPVLYYFFAGLSDIKDLVEAAPKAVKEGVKKEEAEEIQKKIEAAGGSVEVK